MKSKNDPADLIKLAAECVISNSGADLVIYTDGSADADMLNGGAAAVITEGFPEFLEVKEVIMV